MQLNELRPAVGSRRSRKRVGRGPGSGHGKTACKGHKGQKSRSGGGVPPWFEGGQMPLQRRVPKRGFSNIRFKKRYAVLNVSALESFDENAEVTPESLKEKGLIKKIFDGVKILGDGEITKPLKLKVHKISESARKKIEAAQGQIELIDAE